MLVLELDKVYLDEQQQSVKLVRQFVEGDADYEQGMRFRGDNGYNYDANGGVVASVGGSEILQVGALPLVSEDLSFAPTFEIGMGKFYRNGLGKIVFIVDEVSESSRFYASGYRFSDDRGSFYKPNGVVESRGPFTSLNITNQVDAVDVSDADMKRIHENVDRNIRYLNRLDRVKSAVGGVTRIIKRAAKPVAVGAAGGAIGIAIIANR